MSALSLLLSIIMVLVSLPLTLGIPVLPGKKGRQLQFIFTAGTLCVQVFWLFFGNAYLWHGLALPFILFFIQVSSVLQMQLFRLIHPVYKQPVQLFSAAFIITLPVSAMWSYLCTLPR
ncbi:hypothetical protein [Erwinia persicina]|uniref:Uncharacterized protein n=1 Tax=Erwinia persicina TaxID=55211 RepID=A0ABR9A0M4_9GAMM|nr:hypothetical protein [Erwinia persicina]MBD8109223.1 hypothetical protein [Erwinia persicina]MBD8212347.1 hypothetical protein [Erwinia persicina]